MWSDEMASVVLCNEQIPIRLKGRSVVKLNRACGSECWAVEK